MREYDIVRAPAPLDWEKVPTLAIDTPLWGTTADIAAWAQICWDDEGLLVRLRAREHALHVRRWHDVRRKTGKGHQLAHGDPK